MMFYRKCSSIANTQQGHIINNVTFVSVCNFMLLKSLQQVPLKFTLDYGNMLMHIAQQTVSTVPIMITTNHLLERSCVTS